MAKPETPDTTTEIQINESDSQASKPLKKKLFSSLISIFNLIIILISSVILVLFVTKRFLIVPAFRDQHFKNPVLPYYRAIIHYPREEVINQGIIAFLALVIIYLCLDLLFFQKIKGWKKAIVVVLSIIVIFGGTEGVMGFYTKINPEMHRPHPTLFWELAPDLNGLSGGKNVYTNSHGFRSPELPVKKPEGQYRIMILGDSSAFGFRVKNNETFGWVLMKLLRQKYPGRDIQLINAAVAGWTTHQAAAFMRERGWKYSPDIVIVAFNNDPSSELKSDVERTPPKKLIPLLKILYKSNIYLAIKKLVLNERIKKDVKSILEPEGKKSKRRVPIKDFRNNFDSIIDGATDRDAKVIAVSMPLQRSGGFIMDYRNTQKKAVEEEDFPAIDFIGVFQKYPHEEVFMDVMHPTVKGHKIIGEKLYELIVQTQWLDK